MGKAIGGSLPLAVGIALSPIPIIAVVLMLTSRKAKVNGPAFVLGWLIGLGIVGAIVLALAGAGGASKSGSPATWVSWVKIALGVLLLLVAARQFRAGRTATRSRRCPSGWPRSTRPRRSRRSAWPPSCPAPTPRTCCWPWAAPPRSPQTGIPGGQQAIAYLIFALIGTLGVGIPVVIYFAMGERSQKLLAGLKDWMSAHNAVIMAVLCLIIAAKLIGDGIGGLAS